MAQTTYSFKDILAAIVGPGGAINLGDGAGPSKEGITVTPGADINTMTIGADGTGQHSLSGDKSGTVTIRLLKRSSTNALLGAMLAFQRSSGTTHGQNTITITDKNNGEVITCRQCAFKRWPDLTYAEEAGMNEWVFDCIAIDPTLAAGVF